MKRNSLTMRTIFRHLMEDGYYPQLEKSHILFNLDDNVAVLEYEENVLSIRIFFTIEEEAFDMFLDASNSAMMETYLVKPVILDDMRNIMFSFETLCDTERDFTRFFSKGLHRLSEAITIHKAEMKKLILSNEVASAALSQQEETSMNISVNSRKILS
ncbi:MAG: hypothetical protein IJN02_02495 [Bacteroidales bacterium]|nr:hypothetical protein [Bacteroidales bacterium]MBQ6688086.1 hypothetical protein [Bacteroidales bacterium]